MIGPDGHLHRWNAPRKIIQRVLKINASTKSLVERLCDFKIYAISVLGFIGSVCAPDKATFKAERPCPPVHSCRPVQRCTVYPSWESFSSSVSTELNFEDVFSHNMWICSRCYLFHEQVSGIFEAFVVEIDLATIALSCHFALDSLRYKEGAYDTT